jgi:hypothetical protein
VIVNLSCLSMEAVSEGERSRNVLHDRTRPDTLAAVTAVRHLADRLEDAAVEQAMRAGWRWPQVAEALG